MKEKEITWSIYEYFHPKNESQIATERPLHIDINTFRKHSNIQIHW